MLSLQYLTDPDVEQALALRLLLADYHFCLALHSLGLTPKPGGWVTPPPTPVKNIEQDGEIVEYEVPVAAGKAEKSQPHSQVVHGRGGGRRR